MNVLCMDIPHPGEILSKANELNVKSEENSLSYVEAHSDSLYSQTFY